MLYKHSRFGIQPHYIYSSKIVINSSSKHSCKFLKQFVKNEVFHSLGLKLHINSYGHISTLQCFDNSNFQHTYIKKFKKQKFIHLSNFSSLKLKFFGKQWRSSKFFYLFTTTFVQFWLSIVSISWFTRKCATNVHHFKTICVCFFFMIICD